MQKYLRKAGASLGMVTLLHYVRFATLYKEPIRGPLEPNFNNALIELSRSDEGDEKKPSQSLQKTSQ